MFYFLNFWMLEAAAAYDHMNTVVMGAKEEPR